MAHEVRAAKCKQCGKLTYPLHYYCPDCHGTEFEPVPVSGEGTLLTWTRTHNLSLDYSVRFITLGIVEMDMGVRATGQLEIAEPACGARVRARIGKVREINGKDVEGLIFAEV